MADGLASDPLVIASNGVFVTAVVGVYRRDDFILV